ncbi:DUF881 domain-containing protein [Georgenia sp. MJ206]|uniref:DUF881 domain-containing protein n=1 Tax=Georgenia wangjunii TaxID=3117730 RepID=UPI002F268AB0
MRPDVSMTLLREVMDRPLDAGYHEAAERKARGTAPVLPLWRKAVIVAVAATLGLVSVWAARELRAPREGATEARQLLTEEIRDRTAQGETLTEEHAQVVAAIETLQAQRLQGADGAFLDYLQLLGVNAGSAAVSGPGVVITLDDSRDAIEGVPGSDEGFVQDLDLQVVATALWSAGAEAVAINGHRLTTLSAIRSAGRAILVDLAPLARPYTIEAVGDPQSLQTGLARTTGGAHLAALRDTFGISVSISRADDLELSGSPARTLRYANPMATGEDQVPVPGADGEGR